MAIHFCAEREAEQAESEKWKTQQQWKNQQEWNSQQKCKNQQKWKNLEKWKSTTESNRKSLLAEPLKDIFPARLKPFDFRLHHPYICIHVS